MAGIGDDIDKRRFIVLFGNGRLVHALGQKRPGLHRLQGQAHCKPHALAGNRAFEEHGLPVQRACARNNPERNIFHLRIVARVGHSCHLGENLFADVSDQRRNTAHKKPPKDKKSAGR